MKLLVIDTCLAACQAAVFVGGARAASRCEPIGRGHLERIGPMVREVMGEAALAFAGLDRLAVTVGPGSFTGLRVGLAFAKGLALATERPCTGVGVLAALAEGIDEPCNAVIEAGRGAVWLQRFAHGAAMANPTQELAETAALAAGGVLVGPTADALAAPGQKAIVRPWPELDSIARLAEADPSAPAEPLYLRAPDARPRRA